MMGFERIKFERTRHRREQRRNKGVTLMELMFSVLILSFVFTGLVAVFIQINHLARLVKDHSIAGSALNEEMEEIRGMAFSSISALSSSFSTSGMSELDNAVGTVTVTDSFGDSDIRKITLTLTWTSLGGRSMSKSLGAYFVNDGINRQ